MDEKRIEALKIMLAHYAHNDEHGVEEIECCECPLQDYCTSGESTDNPPFTPEEVHNAYVDLMDFIYETAHKIPTEKGEPAEIPAEPEEAAVNRDMPEQTAREIGWREFTLKEAHNAVCTDRNKQYGEPEKSFTAIALMWSAYLHAKGILPLYVEITDEDAALMLAVFKVARHVTAQNPKPDTFADIAGYAACACECAMTADGSRAVVVEDWTGEEKIETRKE